MILHNSIRVAQNLLRRNSHAQTELGDMPSLNNYVRLTSGHRNPLNQIDYNEPLELAGNKHEQYSGWLEHQHCLGSAIIFKGCIKGNQQCAVVVPTNNVESCEDNQPSLRRSVHSITGSNLVQLSDSDLAFLRCSDLSFRPQASSTQAEKLEFGFSSLSRSTLASISSTSSYGKRMPLVVDLLFLNPVAIRPPVSWCLCTIQEKNINKTLEVFVHRELRCLCTLSICGVRNSEARQCGNTNRASYHQDS